jgi:hypothetical protein
MTATVNTRSNRLPLVGLFVLFAAPLAAAFWLYYGTGWRPGQTTNHGTLITPVRELPALTYAQPPARAAVEKLFAGTWSLVVVADGRCDEVCRTALVYARQTFIGMGRLSARMQRVLLATGQCCDRAYLAKEHDGLRVVDLTGDDVLGAARDPLLGAFPAERQGEQIFVVDPLGNLMMRYDTSLDPKGLREDLKKLLDLSHIG